MARIMVKEHTKLVSEERRACAAVRPVFEDDWDWDEEISGDTIPYHGIKLSMVYAGETVYANDLDLELAKGLHAVLGDAIKDLEKLTAMGM